MESIPNIIKNENIGTEAIALRRHIHKNPELSEMEYKTMELICQKLRELDIPYRKNVAGTGIIALIEGGLPGKTVGIRADMDALPIEEMNTELSYCSNVKGVMHACGHDAHTAILWGVAAVLSKIRSSLHGNVKLLFQPAEETVGGAERMIAEGCLENPHVDYMLGLHVDPDIPAGKIGLKYGKMYAASDMLTLKVYGRSCHGARPEQGVDAIVAAAQIINNVQSFVSRNVSPVDSAVCSFGTIHGGNVRNQIADYVELTGIIRTLDPETRLFARERITDICRQTASMLGGRAELIIQPSYSPLINNDAVVDMVRETAGGIIGKDNIVIRDVPSLGVEDFAYFAAARPACFFHLGCGIEGERHRVCHSSCFNINERCIPLGIELQCENVLTLLNG